MLTKADKMFAEVESMRGTSRQNGGDYAAKVRALHVIIFGESRASLRAKWKELIVPASRVEAVTVRV